MNVQEATDILHDHALEHGVEALTRLLEVAQGDSGQCRYVARFLMGLYNGTHYPFDLTNFRALDQNLFEDCMTVLRVDYRPMMEVHCYFENGKALWQQLARNWKIVSRYEEQQIHEEKVKKLECQLYKLKTQLRPL